MTSPNPFQILRDPEFSLFRWDEVQSRRTAQQMPYQYCRGRGVGGSSAINGQIAIRGVVEDFDDWAENGCEGWAFADVLPSFNRLESDMRFGARSYHGGDGPIPIYRAPISRWGAVDQGVAEAALDAGYGWEADHNAPGAIGVSPYAITSRDNKRVSTNEAYVEPARGRANLEIFGDTLVDKIIFSGDRASGLRVITRGEQRTISGSEIILSAGAIHSPAILLRSGIGPESHLRAFGLQVRADLPVGEGLQDHPAAFVPIKLRHFAVPQSNFRHSNVCVRYSSGLMSAGPNDMMIVSLNGQGDSLGSRLSAPQEAVGMIGVWVNQCYSRGTVRLHSLDPFEHPIVEQNMLSEMSDLVRLRDGVRRVLELCDHASVQAIGRAGQTLNLSNDRLDDWLLENVGDAQHAAGSCRMGNGRNPEAVVDDRCRVRNLRGLRVIDASIMPSVVRANTHLTTVMIAEHMAERILLDLN
jgi:5-(hydroxymethyl)furfural/furfural oxidase